MVVSYAIVYGLQLFFTCVLLGIATVQDFKDRLVYDWIWIAGGVIGTIIHVLAIYVWKITAYTWSGILLNFGVALGIVGLMMVPRLFGQQFMMGPADLLGILTIAYLLPFHSAGMTYPIITLFLIPVIFAVLTNTFVLFLGYMLGTLVWNGWKYFRLPAASRTWYAEFGDDFPVGRKILLCCLGHRVPVGDLPKKYRHIKFLERFDEEEKDWYFVFDTGYMDEYSTEEMEQLSQKFQSQGQGLNAIWISPMIPLMVFFLGSLIPTALWGNLVFQFLASFL